MLAVDGAGEVEQHLAGQDAAGGEAHDGDVVAVEAVGVRVGADEPDGPRQVEGALLLGVGHEPVVDDERLVAASAQFLGHREALALVAAEAERASGVEEHRPLDRRPGRDGDAGERGAEVRVVGVSAGVLGVDGRRGDVALLPQVQRLRPRRVGRRDGDRGTAARRCGLRRRHPGSSGSGRCGAARRRLRDRSRWGAGAGGEDEQQAGARQRGEGPADRAHRRGPTGGWVGGCVHRCCSQKATALSIQPSAEVPMPRPKPWPRLGYRWNSVGTPAADRASTRRCMVRQLAMPSSSPTHA